MRSTSADRAFALSPADVVRQIREAGHIKQVVIQGGLNPDLNVAYHVDMLRTIRDSYPNLHIHGYSPSEVHFLAKRARTTSYDILKRLRDAGLPNLGTSGGIVSTRGVSLRSFQAVAVV